MDRSRPVVAAATFSALGAAFGYVIASGYLAYRFGGSLERIDFLFLARNITALRERAPTEFLVSAGIIATFVLLPLLLGAVTLNEPLTTFGRTRWQTSREMKRNGFLEAPGKGFLLGKLGDPRSHRPFLVSATFPHALLIAPTGRGKGVGFVIPNLLTFQGSVVVLDVKGENFRETARRRRSMGDRVIRFAPADWSGRPTHRYNPLQRIAALPNPDQQMMELRLTAGLFLQSDNDRVSGLLQGGIDIFVAAGMLAIQRGRPTLGEIWRLATGGGDKKEHYAALAGEAKHPAVQRMFVNLASINTNTLTSYLSLLLTSGLDVWQNPAIDAATSESDLSFRDVRRRPHAIYLEVAPDMVRPLAPLIRLFFSDLIASLQANEPGPDERWRVMILLDEFDRLGRMPIVAESIKTLRSYGGHLAVVTQTIPALDEIYGQNVRLSLQGGAGVKIYLTPSDQKTVEELSASVGRTTRRVVSKSRPLGLSPLRSRSVSERTEEAPLLSEDEARTMSLDDVVLVIDAQQPIRAKRIKFYEDRTLRALHEAQAGDYPTPDPETAEIAALRHRVTRLEAERTEAPAVPVATEATSALSPETVAAMIAMAQQITAQDTKPATPVSKDRGPPPRGDGVSGDSAVLETAEPALPLAASARRAQMRAAKALAPAVPLDPLIFQDGETRLRAANLRITDLLQQDEPGSQAVEAHPSSDATESLVRRKGTANAVTREDASETDSVEY